LRTAVAYGVAAASVLGAAAVVKRRRKKTRPVCVPLDVRTKGTTDPP